MKKIYLLAVLFLIAGCALDGNRIGCSHLIGSGRFGSLTQYATGDGDTVQVHIGKNLQGTSFTVECSDTVQKVSIP